MVSGMNDQFCNPRHFYQDFFCCIIEQHQKVQRDGDRGIVQYRNPQITIGRVEISLVILAEQLQSEGDDCKYWFEQDKLKNHLFAAVEEYSGDD
jgi:hypothetical protein